jgi:hypothetical protein
MPEVIGVADVADTLDGSSSSSFCESYRENADD